MQNCQHANETNDDQVARAMSGTRAGSYLGSWNSVSSGGNLDDHCTVASVYRDSTAALIGIIGDVVIDWRDGGDGGLVGGDVYVGVGIGALV